MSGPEKVSKWLTFIINVSRAGRGVSVQSLNGIAWLNPDCDFSDLPDSVRGDMSGRDATHEELAELLFKAAHPLVTVQAPPALPLLGAYGPTNRRIRDVLWDMIDTLPSTVASKVHALMSGIKAADFAQPFVCTRMDEFIGWQGRWLEMVSRAHAQVEAELSGGTFAQSSGGQTAKTAASDDVEQDLERAKIADDEGMRVEENWPYEFRFALAQEIVRLEGNGRITAQQGLELYRWAQKYNAYEGSRGEGLKAAVDIFGDEDGWAQTIERAIEAADRAAPAQDWSLRFEFAYRLIAIARLDLHEGARLRTLVFTKSNLNNLMTIRAGRAISDKISLIGWREALWEAQK